MRNSFSYLSTLTLIALFLQSCASTKPSAWEPHIYNNDIEEVIRCVDIAIKSTDINASEAGWLSDEVYHVKIAVGADSYLKSGDVSNNRGLTQGTLKGDLFVKKPAEDRTQVLIREEDQLYLVPGEFRQNLASNLYKELDPLLRLEPKN